MPILRKNMFDYGYMTMDRYRALECDNLRRQAKERGHIDPTIVVFTKGNILKIIAIDKEYVQKLQKIMEGNGWD